MFVWAFVVVFGSVGIVVICLEDESLGSGVMAAGRKDSWFDVSPFATVGDRATVVRYGGEQWALLFGGPTGGTSHIFLDVCKPLAGIFGIMSSVSEGDELMFTRASSERPMDQLEYIRRTSGGPIFTIHVTDSDNLAAVIGIGDFFVEFMDHAAREGCGWSKRFTGECMGSYERGLRASCKVLDDCGFGVGLRGILTGRADQSESVGIKYGVRGGVFPWMGERALLEEFRRVDEQLGFLMILSGEWSGDEVELVRSMLGDYPKLLEAVERAKGEPPEVKDRLDHWDETLRQRQWRAALERMDQYANESWFGESWGPKGE